MGSTILRSHQQRGIGMLRQALASGSSRPMLMLPTGAGKTKIAAAIVNGALAKGKRPVFTVPAISLIDQTAQSFWAEGIRDIGVMQADHPMTDASRPVQIASVQTLQRRQLPEADLVLVDEAHRNHEIIRRWMGETDIPFIGLSATPWSRGLGQFYDRLLIAATIAELIKEGWLSNFRAYAPSKPDLSKARTVAGDWHEGDIAAAMQEGTLTADIVQTWKRLGPGEKTLCFAVDLAHAKTLQVQFEQAGVRCGYIDMNTPTLERDQIRKALDRGELGVVTSVGCLTTGVDWDVRCIILARPSKSKILLTQMVGRGLRPVFPMGFYPDSASAHERVEAMAGGPKPFCILLDHSDTTLRLGFVTDIHITHLDDGKPKSEQADSPDKETPKPKECPQCHYVRAASIRSCPACGYVPEVTSGVKTREGELVDITAHREAEAAAQAEFIAQLRKYAEAKGKGDSWVLARFKAKFKAWPTHPRVRAAAPAAEVSPEVIRWLRSRDIAWAKGSAKARAHG